MIRISGIHAVSAELTHNPEHIKRIFINSQASNPRIHAIVEQASTLSAISLEYLSHTKFSLLIENDNHQGVVAEISPKNIKKESDLKEHLENHRGLSLVLDSVTDTRNLGACLRSAKAFGVESVILPNAHSASINHHTYKASAGALSALHIFIVANLARSITLLKNNGYWIVGLDAHASTDIREYDFTGSHAIVMGSESSGLRELTKKHCDTLVKIPMSGDMESLNISVATGIALFAAIL